jgi:cyclic pyranopterin phosphate synthase
VEDGGMTGKQLSHLDENGRARMVDVSSKQEGPRKAVAEGRIRIGAEAMEMLSEDAVPKGDVAAAARIAGISAVKRTPELIPLCHPLRIDSVDVSFRIEGDSVVCTCEVSGVERTGFEMEALTGVSIALLTVYDMLKSVDKGMEIGPVRLLEKTGGKSGEYRWKA